MMLLRRLTCLIILKVIVLSVSQQYQEDYPEYYDYADGSQGQDNLYQNYAQHMDKKYGANDGVGIGFPKMILTWGGAWLIGYFHAGLVKRPLIRRQKDEQDALKLQHYTDAYKFMETNQELQYQVEVLQNEVVDAKDKAASDQVQRDYDEFKQPDVDGDERISRAEFNMYVEKYLSNYPGLKEKDYPKFEDFDHDGDGYVGFAEYSKQMALQVRQAEEDAIDSGSTTTKAKAYKEMLSGSNSYYL